MYADLYAKLYMLTDPKGAFSPSLVILQPAHKLESLTFPEGHIILQAQFYSFQTLAKSEKPPHSVGT